MSLVIAALTLAAACAGRAPRPRVVEGAEPARVRRVIDGDTLEVEWNGRLERLRLACVDTEESIAGRARRSLVRPETVFGEETALWLRGLLAASAGGACELVLAFHPGERRDVFGRLLAHATLPDGRELNTLLVAEGRSPYFQKYGYCPLRHAELARAQSRARRSRRGIWSARTNAPSSRGAPSVRRPYPALLAWWQARAEAIEGFRKRRRDDPAGVVSAEEPQELARAAGGEVQVFGSIAWIDEPRGALCVWFHHGGGEALRVLVPAESRDALLAAFDPHATLGPFRQNYVTVTGTLEHDRRGFLVRAPEPAQWRLAGPSPAAADRGG